MKLSTAMFAQRASAGIQERSASLAKLQEAVATGRRVNQPGDDPVAAAEAERLRSSRAAMAIDRRMMSYATSMLSHAESALASGGDILQTARELMISAGNGTYGPEDRRQVATQLEGLRAELLALANQRDGTGGYVFGGQGTADAPFSAAGETTFSANAGTRMTGMGMAFDTTVNGARVFLGDGATAVPGSGSIFAALDTVIGQLRDPALSGSALTAALSTAIDTADQSLDRILTARTDIGEQLRAIESRTRLLESGDLRAQSRISELIDTDYAAALTDMQSHQIAMQAAMQTYAQISRLSLFDYL